MFDTTNPADAARVEAMVAQFDVDFPGWEDRERMHDTLLDESDFAVDFPADEWAVPAEDWDAMAEVLWTDPAERPW